MKREIKFRYWSVKNNKYASTEDMPTCGEDSEIFELSGWDSDVFEQFTGLKDKNGKEIYEGDIVYWKHIDSYGVIYYNSDEVQYYAKPIKTHDETESYLDSIHMEVIGNIHENTELL